ncbi:hypothetical protein KO495_11950 [Colwellia sp. D2M02]|nr:hypothetical protein [Colwellia sp. D2M02]
MTKTPKQYARSLLCGCWFSTNTTNEGLKSTEYSEILPDGSFEFTFSRFDSNNQLIEKVTELGDWGLVGDIHFTITKDEVIDEQLYAADLNDEGNYQAYRVLQLNHQIFEYQHILTNETYIMRRVVDNIGHC